MDLASLTSLALKASIPLIVFGLGLHADWSDITYLFRRPAKLLRAVASMYIVMPLAVSLMVATFHPLPAVGLALIALSLSPVPPVLPKKQVKAGGDVPYVGGLLVAMSLLAIVAVPLGVTWLGRLFDREVSIEPVAVAQVVALTVLVPLAVGLVVRQFAPTFAERIARPAGLLGTLLLAFAGLALGIKAWPAMQGLMHDGTLVMIAAFVVLGLVVGHLLGGPDEGSRSALALSTSTRHPGVAMAVIAAVGAPAKEVLPAVLLYLVVGAIVSLPYMKWRRSREGAPAGPARRNA